MQIGIWPYPMTPEIHTFLQAAADVSGGQVQTGPGWHVWTIHRDGELIGAANCSRTVDHAVEVVLVGGREFRRWLGLLDERVGAWARDEGATCLRAYGRDGWARVLKWGRIGPDWQTIGPFEDVTHYERRLT
jgi:hypothetical protein